MALIINCEFDRCEIPALEIKCSIPSISRVAESMIIVHSFKWNVFSRDKRSAQFIGDDKSRIRKLY